MVTLRKRITKTMSGNENLTFSGESIGCKLIDFWKWSASDILSNTTRGIFAEFIVAKAMDMDLKNDPRNVWSEYDLETWEWGKIKIEVKSSSYLQAWDQRSYSNINFSIKKRGTTSIRKDKNVFSRPSDVYVFCLLDYKDKKTVNPLNMDQWSFYVVSTKKINDVFQEKNTITLKSLENITESLKYDQLKQKIIHEAKNN